MSKVSAYLQGHINGEISTRLDERKRVATDNSVLTETPEMVAYPRTTNDVRKLVRFAWQLAEKGHTLPVMARGQGAGVTAGGLGKGLVVDMSRHMNHIYEYDSKQKLVRMQPGVSLTALDTALRLHGVSLPALTGGKRGTVGGAVAEDYAGILAGKYGSVGSFVSQLEVVLDSGDVLQTEKLSKRELNRRKGVGGRIGDIYRGIDTVLEDHAEFIAEVNKQPVVDRSGYPGIFEVRDKKGNFDLTPLIIGSQGTLGIVSEMIMKTEFLPSSLAECVAVFESADEARDALEQIRALSPAILEYIDGSLVQNALRQGNTYPWIKQSGDVGALLIIGFCEFSERTTTKRVKKLRKLLESKAHAVLIPDNETDRGTVRALYDIARYLELPSDSVDSVAPVLIEAAYVPHDTFDTFTKSLAEIASELKIPVALQGSALTGIYSLRPSVSMKKVGDKRALLKLVDQVNALVDGLGGSLVGAGAEGRTLARFVRGTWDDEYATMVDEIRKVFDPHGIFAPQAKAATELKNLAANLRSDNSIGVI